MTAPDPPRVLLARLPATFEAVSDVMVELRGALGSSTVPPERHIDLMVMLAELLNNVAEHAYDDRPGGWIELEVVGDCGGATALMVDAGRPLPPGLVAKLSPARDAPARPCRDRPVCPQAPARPAAADPPRVGEAAAPAAPCAAVATAVGGPVAGSVAGPVGGPGGGAIAAHVDVAPIAADDATATGDATDDLPEGGFGWPMILVLARSIEYRREGDRNVLQVSI